MKKDGISDHELLALIHKNIDVERLRKQNEAITKARIDKLFQNLRIHAKESKFSISAGQEEKDISSPHSLLVQTSSGGQFDVLIVNIDGASRGNPGKAGVGVAIFDRDLKLVKECSEYIGIATNNMAEYKALILGIKEVIKCSAPARLRRSGGQEILFKTDSELLAKQIMGEYKVKSTQLMYLFTEAQRLLKKLPKWKIKYIPRVENKKADMLANKGIEMSVEDDYKG
jgi:ribonuclease HI